MVIQYKNNKIVKKITDPKVIEILLYNNLFNFNNKGKNGINMRDGLKKKKRLKTSSITFR